MYSCENYTKCRSKLYWSRLNSWQQIRLFPLAIDFWIWYRNIKLFPKAIHKVDVLVLPNRLSTVETLAYSLFNSTTTSEVTSRNNLLLLVESTFPVSLMLILNCWNSTENKLSSKILIMLLDIYNIVFISISYNHIY